MGSTIFVSHSSFDDASTDQIVDWLKVEGYEGFFVDHGLDGLSPNQFWVDQLLGKLQRCQAMIVVHSEAWTRSQWCFAEAVQAVGSRIPVYVVCVDDSNPSSGPAAQLLRPLEVSAANALHLKDGDAMLARLSRYLRQSGVDPASSIPLDQSHQVFPGLRSFEIEDVGSFYGRRVETVQAAAMAQRLRSSGRLGVLVGPSGAGKSSLMRAGLASQVAMDTSSWIMADPFTPGASPFDELEAVLDRLGRTHDIVSPTSVQLASTDGGNALARFARSLRRKIGGNKRLLLLIDQFEEVSAKAVGDEARIAADRFLSTITTTSDAAGDDWPVVVTTLRSDMTSWLQTASSSLGFEYETIHVDPLTVPQLRAVVRRSLEDAELIPDEDFVNKLVDDASDGRSLPLVGLALQRLDEQAKADGRHRITLQDYAALSHLTLADIQASNGLSELVVAQAPEADYNSPPLRQTLLAMVQPVLDHQIGSGPSDLHTWSRRVALLDEVDSRARPVIDQLVNARLLTTGHSEAGPTVEVAHESIFSFWSPMRTLLREFGPLLAVRSQLDSDATDWDKTGRRDKSRLWGGSRLEQANQLLQDGVPTAAPAVDFVATSFQQIQRTNRIRRSAIGGLASLTIIAVVAASLAIVNQRAAEESEAFAQTQADEAQASAIEAEEKALEATANQLASASRAATSSHNAAILALEAALLTPNPTPLAQEALGEATLRLARDPVATVVDLDQERGSPLTWTEEGNLLGIYKDGAWRWSDNEIETFPDLGPRLRWSADGSSLSTVPPLRENTHMAFDVVSGEVIWSLERPQFEEGRISNVWPSPQFEFVAYTGDREVQIDQTSTEKTVFLWDTSVEPDLIPDAHVRELQIALGAPPTETTPDREVELIADRDDSIKEILWSITGGRLAIVRNNTRVTVFDVQLAEVIADFLPPPIYLVNELHWSPDGTQLLLNGPRSGALIWSIYEPDKLDRIGGTAFVDEPSWSPRGDLIAAGTGPIDIYDATTGHIQQTINDPSKVSSSSEILPSGIPARTKVWSPNGAFLAAAHGTSQDPGDIESVAIWNIRSGRRVAVIPPSDEIVGLKWSADGRYLAGIPEDGQAAVVWDVGRLFGPNVVPQQWHHVGDNSQGSFGSADSIAYLPDGSFGYNRYDGTAVVRFGDSYEAERELSHQVIETFDNAFAGTAQPAFLWSRSGLSAYVAPDEENGISIEIVDGLNGQPIARHVAKFDELPDFRTEYYLSPSGELVIFSVEYPDALIVFNLDSGKRVTELSFDDGTSLVGLDWVDDQEAVAVYVDGSIEVISLPGGERTVVANTPDGLGVVNTLTSVPSQQVAYLGFDDGRVFELDLIDFEIKPFAQAHGVSVLTTVASADGSMLATYGSDSASGLERTVRVWQTASHQLFMSMSVDVSRALALAPDGRELAWAGEDAIRTFRLLTYAEVCDIALRAPRLDELRQLAPDYDRYLCIEDEIPSESQSLPAGYAMKQFATPGGTKLSTGDRVYGKVPLLLDGHEVTLDFGEPWTVTQGSLHKVLTRDSYYQDEDFSETGWRYCSGSRVTTPLLQRSDTTAVLNSFLTIASPLALTDFIDLGGPRPPSADELIARAADSAANAGVEVTELPEEEIFGLSARAFLFTNKRNPEETCWPRFVKHWLFDIDGASWIVTAHSNDTQQQFEEHLDVVEAVLSSGQLDL